MVNPEFHFDFGSPNAFLAHLAIPQIEKRTGVTFDYVPVLLGGVFKATNNVSPMQSLQGIMNKPEYLRIETDRWLRRYGVDSFQPNPYFPVNTLQIMRGAIYAQKSECFDRYVETVFHGMWRDALKMDELDTIASCLEAAGLPASEIIDGMQSPEVKQALIQNTASSVERGTFGSPTFYVGDEIYFGKDTLRDIEELFTE